YAVTFTVGDAAAAHDQMAVTLEGLSAGTYSTAAGQFLILTKTVTVTGGRLDVGLTDLGGSDPWVALQSLTIDRVPFSATFGKGGAVNEGSTGSVSFTNVTGGSGGYTYSYDFNNDGTFEVTGSASASATVPASFLDDGPSTPYVRGRVTDSSGAFVEYTTSIVVNNVAPSATISGPSSAAVGTAVTFSATATDPSTRDTQAGFNYFWTFG